MAADNWPSWQGKLCRSDFVIVGGGVAGVCCAQTLAEAHLNASITLVTSKDVVKLVTSCKKLTRALEEVIVEERPSYSLTTTFPNIKVINDTVIEVDCLNSNVSTAKGSKIQYKKLCLCTGASPNLIETGKENVIGIRDVDSVSRLQEKLKDATRVVVVGNGGIALELVYELIGCEVIWVIKDDAIGNVFLDRAAADFLLPSLNQQMEDSSHPRKADTVIFKRKKYGSEREGHLDHGDASCRVQGGALGPDWSMNLQLKGKIKDMNRRSIHIEYNCEVRRIIDADEVKFMNCSELPSNFDVKTNWPTYVELSNGKTYGTDFVISATGVKPNTDLKFAGAELILSDDGGIKVDENMRTNIANVYAAGDVCTTSWQPNCHWFQMRLWTQAYQMGVFAANCITRNLANEEATLDFCFELFAHVTSFFGYKLCILGRYNAQGLNDDYEILVRYSPGEEYVKVVLKDGYMVGALLLGETDLEETFENLILNQMDLSRFSDNLLDPDIDIEDFFD